MGGGLYTKAEWASLVGLAHVGMRLLQAEFPGRLEDVAWVHRCGDLRDAEPCSQFVPQATLEHHVGVDRAGRQVGGARRGSA
jgi:hypothetical protein